MVNRSLSLRRGFATLDLAIGLGLIIALGAALYGAERSGETRGKALQLTIDQPALTKASNDIDSLHVQATAMEAQRASDNAKAAALDRQLHAEQDARYVSDQAATEANRRAAAAVAAHGGLRITVPVAAACSGAGSGAGMSSTASTADGPAATTTVQLPAATGASILDTGHDADRLADSYRRCYAAWFPAWKPTLTSAADEPSGIFDEPGVTTP